MDRVSYNNLRIRIETGIQWLAEVGDSHDKFNGKNVLEWMEKFLIRFEQLEKILQEEKERLESQCEEARVEKASYIKLEDHLKQRIYKYERCEHRCRKLVNERAELWDITQHQATFIAERASQYDILAARTSLKIARLEKEVVKQSEQVEILNDRVRTLEVTATAGHAALFEAAMEMKRFRLGANMGLLDRMDDADLCNQISRGRLRFLYQEQLNASVSLSAICHSSQSIAEDLDKFRDQLKAEQEVKSNVLRTATAASHDIALLRRLFQHEKGAHATTTAALCDATERIQELTPLYQLLEEEKASHQTTTASLHDARREITRLRGLLEEEKVSHGRAKAAAQDSSHEVTKLRKLLEEESISHTNTKTSLLEAIKASQELAPLCKMLEEEKASHAKTASSLLKATEENQESTKRLEEEKARHAKTTASFQEATESAGREAAKLRQLLAQEQGSLIEATASLQIAREVAISAKVDSAKMSELLEQERSSNAKTLQEAQSEVDKLKADFQRLLKLLVECRTREAVREGGSGHVHYYPDNASPASSQPSSNNSNSGLVSWSGFPDEIAGKLHAFRLRVAAPSALTREEIAQRFAGVCEQEAVMDRLGELISTKAGSDDWYCFEHVCQYGIYDDRSKALPRSCKHHQSCLVMRGLVLQTRANIVCRGIGQ
ncbi:hypothetical protein F4774DRAFT_408685 [Daldinia eschscholtzii]|nr:hypothetical protein F4774DRAFT_408685 [Daldinia eschscholtzii]